MNFKTKNLLYTLFIFLAEIGLGFILQSIFGT